MVQEFQIGGTRCVRRARRLIQPFQSHSAFVHPDANMMHAREKARTTEPLARRAVPWLERANTTRQPAARTCRRAKLEESMRKVIVAAAIALLSTAAIAQAPAPKADTKSQGRSTGRRAGRAYRHVRHDLQGASGRQEARRRRDDELHEEVPDRGDEVLCTGQHDAEPERRRENLAHEEVRQRRRGRLRVGLFLTKPDHRARPGGMARPFPAPHARLIAPVPCVTAMPAAS